MRKIAPGDSLPLCVVPELVERFASVTPAVPTILIEKVLIEKKILPENLNLSHASSTT
jgi:hypothetical protein